MKFPESLQRLLLAFRRLPGIGPKSAQRMAFHLLERDREAALTLAQALSSALSSIRRCERCRMFAEEALCTICASPTRDAGVLCVVESPSDVIAIEESASFRGCYYVLHGRLSPLDGIGPVEIGLDGLDRRLRDGSLSEVILATSATVEGEATAGFIAGIARISGVPATRIARGVPLGGELEYVDSGTLSRAMTGRVSVRDDETQF